MAHSRDIKPKYKVVNIWIKNHTDATIEYKKEPLAYGLTSSVPHGILLHHIKHKMFVSIILLDKAFFKP